jgi:hypothetical protein
MLEEWLGSGRAGGASRSIHRGIDERHPRCGNHRLDGGVLRSVLNRASLLACTGHFGRFLTALTFISQIAPTARPNTEANYRRPRRREPHARPLDELCIRCGVGAGGQTHWLPLNEARSIYTSLRASERKPFPLCWGLELQATRGRG